MSRLGALVSAAFLEGFFLAISTKIGTDVSPVGIFENIMIALEPIIIPQTQWVFDYGPMILSGVLWLVIFVDIERVGRKRGAAIFIIITVGTYALIMHYF
jgi:hypothetical protein